MEEKDLAKSFLNVDAQTECFVMIMIGTKPVKTEHLLKGLYKF
jgi:hypothetical protein